MAITKDLLLAILSMDAYNRGYNLRRLYVRSWRKVPMTGTS